MLSKIFAALSIVAFGFLCLLMGVVTTHYKVFPYPMIRNAWQGVAAGLSMLEIRLREPFERTGWIQQTSEVDGVSRYTPDRAFNGLTLFTSSHAQKAFLMDMDGRVVHTWALPFSELWNETAAVRKPLSDELVSWRSFYLYPNGDLLVVYHGADVTPYGYGLAKLDKDSRLLWSYLQHAHHDVAVDENGLIYTITHEIRNRAMPEFAELRPPMLEEFLVVLSPAGKEVKKISLFEAFAKSPFRRAMGAVANNGQGDYFHANAVDPVSEAIAGAFPFVHPGQALVSLRNIDALVVVDLEEEAVVWFAHGAWRRQHDPDFLANGRLLVFDNVGDIANGRRSRVLEFDPVTQHITWEYKTTDQEELFSYWGASQQYLPNGNVLIVESVKGRLLEVTRDKEVVWEYFNAAHNVRDPSYRAVILEAQRFARDELTFPFNGG